MSNKKLNTLDATMLVMGSMIGSGIFLVSAEVYRLVGSSYLMLGTWVLTSFLTITGAYAYSKLSTEIPKTGGQYIYLKEAYSPMIGFLFGWSTFLVIQTGTIAAVAVAFAKYTGYLFPDLLNEQKLLFNYIDSQQILAVLSIIILTLINMKGVQMAALVQNIFTFSKIASLLFLLVWGLYVGFSNHWIHFEDFFQSSKMYDESSKTFVPLGNILTFSMFGAAMIGPLFSSSAWNNLTFASQDFENPKVTIARGLVYGTIIVCVIYILTNVAYLGILSPEQIMFAKQDRIGSLALEIAIGPIGAIIMAIMIMVSTFGCNNGIILSGGRLFEAMSNDSLFFKIASVQNKSGVPKYSLLIQCIWACLLCFSGSYNQLLDYTVFAILIFYFLTVFILFKKSIYDKKLNRNQKILFITYLVFLLLIAGNLLIAKPLTSITGLMIVLSGIPIYFIFKKSIK
jgi:APA family basic amino acid/polyamine antiporter